MSKSPRLAVYFMRFKRVTRADIDIIMRSANIFEEVAVVIRNVLLRMTDNEVAEMIAMLKKATQRLSNVSVDTTSKNFLSYLRDSKARVEIKAVSFHVDEDYDTHDESFRWSDFEPKNGIEPFFMSSRETDRLPYKLRSE